MKENEMEMERLKELEMAEGGRRLNEGWRDN